MNKPEKIQLPIFQKEEIGLLPTDKMHTSFSEMSNWSECSWRHMLAYVKKIEGDKGSIHTSFGKTVHDAIEHYLRDGKLHTDTEIVDIFKRELDGSEVEIKDKDFESFTASAIRLKNAFPAWFESEFPGAKVFAIEHLLFEKVPGIDGRYFKGFIDCVLKVPKVARKNSKKPAEGFNYVVIDWKTCSWGWNVEKKRDPMKIAQLAFYKHFFSAFFNVPLSDIKVAFVLAKRTPKADTIPFEVVPISVGTGTIDKALKLLRTHLLSVDKKLYMKNRSSCRWCSFKDTPHCV